MIELSIQLKLIIFSFVFGFNFSILLDYFYYIIKNHNKLFSIIISFLLVLLMTIVYFVGISKIGNVTFHFYSILLIIVGFITYDIILKLIANITKK